ADSLTALGSLLEEMKFPRLALPHLDEAFAICDRLLGEEHVKTLETVLQLADMTRQVGMDADARQLLLRYLEVCLRTRGETDLLTASFRRRIGSTFLALNDPAGAKVHLLAAYETHRGLLGDDDPRTWDCLDSLLLAVMQLGRPEDAP